jgi:hypothetical protein
MKLSSIYVLQDPHLMLVHDYDAVARIAAEFLFQSFKELKLIIPLF